MRTRHTNDTFGVGPTGAAVGLFLLLIAMSLDKVFELPVLHFSIGNKVLVVLFLFTLASLGIYHSVRLLPLNKRSKELITIGMYGRVRHPIYFCMIFFIYPAFAVIMDSITALVFTIVYYITFIFLAKKEENGLLNIFGEKYVRYMNEVPKFIPKLK